MTGVCCLKLSKLQACGSCFILVRKPLAMPVVPAMVPPLSPFRDGSSRPTTGARRGGCAVREGREPRARIAHRTRAGIARATWRGCRGVAGGCCAARPKGRSAGRPGCRAAPGWWGGRLTRPHAYLPPDRAQARRGRRGGQVGGHGRDHAARAAPGAGGPCGRGPDDVGEGLPRGHRRPRRVGHRPVAAMPLS